MAKDFSGMYGLKCHLLSCASTPGGVPEKQFQCEVCNKSLPAVQVDQAPEIQESLNVFLCENALRCIEFDMCCVETHSFCIEFDTRIMLLQRILSLS